MTSPSVEATETPLFLDFRAAEELARIGMQEDLKLWVGV